MAPTRLQLALRPGLCGLSVDEHRKVLGSLDLARERRRHHQMTAFAVVCLLTALVADIARQWRLPIGHEADAAQDSFVVACIVFSHALCVLPDPPTSADCSRRLMALEYCKLLTQSWSLFYGAMILCYGISFTGAPDPVPIPRTYGAFLIATAAAFYLSLMLSLVFSVRPLCLRASEAPESPTVPEPVV